MTFIVVRSNFADCVTGERVFPGDRVFDTGFANVKQPYMVNGRTRYIKEDTIVKLAEEAGFRICRGDCNCGDDKSDVGVSEPTPSMVGEDVGVGSGKVKARKSKAGGSKSGGLSYGPVESE